MRVIEPSYTVLTSLEGLEALIELAGRTCYKSEDRITPDSAGRFVRSIILRGHESVIEHGSITIRFVCDRGVSHELVRHRLASFSQESTRYCNYGKKGELTFIRPLFFEDGSEKYAVWEELCQHAERAYLKLLELGAKPEEARSVLPNSLKTELVMTANLREWRHVMKLRAAPAAHPQMRQLMEPLHRDLQALLPEIFGG